MDNPAFEYTGDTADPRGPFNQQRPKKIELDERVPLRSQTVELKKNIGYFSSVGIIVGTIIGSGIFISPKGVLLNSGSVGLSLVIWTICGVISFLGSLAFAELGTLIPDTGGEYIYLLEGFAPDRKTQKSWWRPLFAFLQCYVMIIVRPGSLAIQGLTCGEYIVRLGSFYCEDPSDYISPKGAVKCIAACLIMIMVFLNIYSVNATAKTQNFFTTVKVLALCLIIISGMVRLFQGHTQVLAEGFQGTKFGFGNIASAFYSGLFAYAGWDNINNIAIEMKDPHKDLLPSMMTSMAVVIGCYILVNISYLTGLTTDELLKSDAVAVSYAGNAMGVAGSVIIVASVACSTFGAGNGGTLTSVRVLYTAAREGQMIEVLSYINIHYFTPVPAIVCMGLIAFVFVIPANVGSLISMMGFVEWIFMGLSMIALLIMRKTKKNVPRTVKVPLVIPVIVLLFSIFVVITPLIENPKVEFLYVLVFLLIGVVMYFPFVYYKKSLPYTANFYRFIQKLFLAMPSEKEL